MKPLDDTKQYVFLAIALALIVAGSGSLPFLDIGVSEQSRYGGKLAIFFYPGYFLSGLFTHMHAPNIGLAIVFNWIVYGFFFYLVIRPWRSKNAR